MNTTDAIKRAIDSGYKYNGIVPVFEPFSSRTQSGWLIYSEHQGVKISASVNEFQVFLDPAFWQCLGKAEGWGINKKEKYADREVYITGWKYHWHSFIDALADGETADEYFNLLRK